MNDGRGKIVVKLGMVAAVGALAVTVTALAFVLPGASSPEEWEYPEITPEEYEASLTGERPQVTAEDLAALVDPDDRSVLDAASHMSSVLDVVQWVGSHIAYGKDVDTYGKSEWWARPAETLFNHYADCEDYAILIASLSLAMGHSPELVVFGAAPAGHIAVLCGGIYLDPMAVHGQPPVDETTVSSILGIAIHSDGEISQRVIDKKEVFS